MLKSFIPFLMWTALSLHSVGCQSGYMSGEQPSNPVAKKHMVRAGEIVNVKLVEEAPDTNIGAAAPLAPLAAAAITGLVSATVDQVQKYIEREVSLHQATYSDDDAVTEFYENPSANTLRPKYSKLTISRDVPKSVKKGASSSERLSALDVEISMLPVSDGASSLALKMTKLEYLLAAAKLTDRNVQRRPVTVEVKLEFFSAWSDKDGKWHDEALGKPVVFTVQNAKVGQPTVLPTNQYVIPAPPLSIVGDAKKNATLRVTGTVTETDQSRWPEIRKQLAAQLKDLKQPLTNVVIDLAGLPTTQPAKK